MGKWRRKRRPRNPGKPKRERLWERELTQRLRHEGTEISFERAPTEYKLRQTPPPSPKSKFLHRRKIECEVRPDQHEKGSKQYTTLNHNDGFAIKAYRKLAKQDQTATEFDIEASLDTTDHVCRSMGLPPRFPKEIRPRYLNPDPLLLERDRYNSHNRFARSGPPIMLRQLLRGTHHGVFVRMNKFQGALPLPYRPPYLTILSARDPSWSYGRVEAAEDTIVEFIWACMDPLGFFYKLMCEEIDNSDVVVPHNLPPRLVRTLLDDPCFNVEIDHAENDVFSTEAIYDLLLANAKRQEEGKPTKLFMSMDTPSHDDPLPWSEGSRERHAAWFGELPLRKFDEAILYSGDVQLPAAATGGARRKRKRTHTGDPVPDPMTFPEYNAFVASKKYPKEVAASLAERTRRTFYPDHDMDPGSFPRPNATEDSSTFSWSSSAEIDQVIKEIREAKRPPYVFVSDTDESESSSSWSEGRWKRKRKEDKEKKKSKSKSPFEITVSSSSYESPSWSIDEEEIERREEEARRKEEEEKRLAEEAQRKADEETDRVAAACKERTLATIYEKEKRKNWKGGVPHTSSSGDDELEWYHPRRRSTHPIPLIRKRLLIPPPKSRRTDIKPPVPLVDCGVFKRPFTHDPDPTSAIGMTDRKELKKFIHSACPCCTRDPDHSLEFHPEPPPRAYWNGSASYTYSEDEYERYSAYVSTDNELSEEDYIVLGVPPIPKRPLTEFEILEKRFARKRSRFHKMLGL
jgi:hypothetical protein